MLWATNYYLVCWHHSLWENWGHLELLLPCASPADAQSEAKAVHRANSPPLPCCDQALWYSFGIPDSMSLSSVHHFSCESCPSLWTSERGGERPQSIHWRRKDQPCRASITFVMHHILSWLMAQELFTLPGEGLDLLDFRLLSHDFLIVLLPKQLEPKLEPCLQPL